jgi:hypothetical protein
VKKALLDVHACSGADIAAESTFLHDAIQANIAAHTKKESTAAAMVVDEHDIEACR